VVGRQVEPIGNRWRTQVTEHVQANTDDLADFTAAGSIYRTSLDAMMVELERRRTIVVSSLSHSPATNWTGPFSTYAADANASDQFVQTVHDALLDIGTGVAGPTIMGPGGPFNRTRHDLRTGELDPEILAIAAENGVSYAEADFAVSTLIIDSLQAEIDAWTGHPNDPRTTELHGALAAEVEHLVGGDAELARHVRVQLAQGDSAAEALFDGVIAANQDTSIEELLTAVEARSGDPDAFDPIGYALQATLVGAVEDFTGADLADVNIGLAAMAQQSDLSYNSAVALINMDMASEESDWPAGSTPFEYLDVPITSGEEAAYLMMADEEGLFRVIETANQGNLDDWDGKLSDSDWAAVLADPDAFDERAVAIAQFFNDSPEEWALFDTAREGLALQNLADGTMGAGDGDGITSFADVQQYVTNRQLFNTLSDELLRTDSVIRDLDANGRLDPDEFEAALSAIEATHPNFEGLNEAITFALDQDLLDEPDDRAWYEQIADGVFTVSSLVPGSPTQMYRMLTDPDGLARDHLSFVTGAGHAVVGLGLFAYDVSAIGPGSPGFWVENWRVDGDLSEHRGIRLAQSIPHLANAGLSLVPGTPQFDNAMHEVRRQGTWDAHAGLELGRSVIDWEGFVEDPAAWAGQFAPEVLITVLTGGGGAVTRLGTTGSRVASAARRFVVGVSNNGLRASTAAALRNGVGRLSSLSSLGVRWQDTVARFGRQRGTLADRLRSTWQTRPLTGTLADANFAQNNVVRGTKPFSEDGQRIFTEAAGYPIETVDDLAEALRTGAISPSQVQVDYVVIDGQRLILNTRTSTALRKADIPQSQWHGRDQTGISVDDGVTFDDLARAQLERNGLPTDGSPSLGIDPPGMVRGEQIVDPRIAQRQLDNAELRDGDRFATDQATAGVDAADIGAMFDGRRPLGFTSEAQYAQFSDELAEALRDAGLDDAEIGLKGTATTFYSENPGKPLGHHWDADPENPGDYDLNLTSEKMVVELESRGLEPHPDYGVFRTRDIEAAFPALDEFQTRWSEVLGRDVNVVGYPEPTFRDLTEYVVVDGPGS